MEREHWRVWHCFLGCTDASFDNLDQFLKHNQSVHAGELVGHQPNIHASSVRDTTKVCGQCPLCLDVQLGSEKDYASHVGRHLETLALFALPRVDDDYSTGDETPEDDEDISNGSDGELGNDGHAGLESIGLVLGVLPLAVEALTTYREILSSVQKVRNDLDNLIQDLQTQMLRLQISCEILLQNLVPPDKVSDVLDHPTSPKWADLALSRELLDVYPMFEGEMRGLRAVGLELEKKLCLREKRPEDKKAILQKMKAKDGFTLKKKDFDDIISRLDSTNCFIQSLAADAGVV